MQRFTISILLLSLYIRHRNTSNVKSLFMTVNWSINIIPLQFESPYSFVPVGWDKPVNLFHTPVKGWLLTFHQLPCLTRLLGFMTNTLKTIGCIQSFIIMWTNLEISKGNTRPPLSICWNFDDSSNIGTCWTLWWSV